MRSSCLPPGTQGRSRDPGDRVRIARAGRRRVSATARSTCPRCRASFASTTSSGASAILRRRSSSAIASRPRATTGANSSPSGRTASCTFRSACRATSASSTRIAYGVIMRMNPDGSALEVFARGLRNSVGFDWDPRTRELWFTDNGRDMLGDDAAAGYAQSCAAERTALRLSLLSRGDDARPRVRQKAALQRSSARRRRISGLTSLRWACASTRERSFRRLSQPDLHRRARVLEPQPQDRLSRHDGDAGRRQGRALRAVRRRVAAGRAGVGTSGGRAGRAGRLAARCGRFRGGDLSDPLRPGRAGCSQVALSLALSC